MSFDKLLRKVGQAEDAVQAQRRRASADWRQFRRSWRATWTPARIVVAGLLGGYAVGRAQPLDAVGGSGVLRMLASLSTLLASGQASAAASEAEDAAQAAGKTAASASATASASAADERVHVPTATAEAFDP